MCVLYMYLYLMYLVFNVGVLRHGEGINSFILICVGSSRKALQELLFICFDSLLTSHQTCWCDILLGFQMVTCLKTEKIKKEKTDKNVKR